MNTARIAMNTARIAMNTARIAVIGTGYVGLTTGACLASLGHAVLCIDSDAAKLARLARGEVDILEPGLAELVKDGIATQRLTFASTTSTSGVGDADMVFLCLPTPKAADGSADLATVRSVISEIRLLLRSHAVVVMKSTVPVGSSARVAQWLGRRDVAVVSNPEFLREGSAVDDFLHPDRIVVGATDERARSRVAALYAQLAAPTVLADTASAEMVKYAANCFLATKLSYVNAVADVCEQLGANVDDVTEAMGLDRRVGPAFLRPGPGWGGSCLPKDTTAMSHTCHSVGFEFPLLDHVIAENVRQRHKMVDKIATLCGTGRDRSLHGVRLGLLGLTFKAGTNDLRDSPAVAIAGELAGQGAELTAYDPAVPSCDLDSIGAIGTDGYQAAEGAHGLVLLTEWPQFQCLDWSRVAELMSGAVVVDTRNHLDPDALRRAGLSWHGIGRRPVRVNASVAQ